MPSFQIGEIRVDRIVDWDGPFLTAMQMFPDASRAALEPHLDWLAPGALSADELRINLPVQSYLVRSGRHTLLIDTCVGCGKSHDVFPGWGKRNDENWLANL